MSATVTFEILLKFQCFLTRFVILFWLSRSQCILYVVFKPTRRELILVDVCCANHKIVYHAPESSTTNDKLLLYFNRTCRQYNVWWWSFIFFSRDWTSQLTFLKEKKKKKKKKQFQVYYTEAQLTNLNFAKRHIFVKLIYVTSTVLLLNNIRR